MHRKKGNHITKNPNTIKNNVTMTWISLSELGMLLISSALPVENNLSLFLLYIIHQTDIKDIKATKDGKKGIQIKTTEVYTVL